MLINEQHILNLTEIVRQNTWLALPRYPGCNWEGPSPCPNLADLMENLGDVRLLHDDESSEEVAAGKETVDPRWSALLRRALVLEARMRIKKR